MRPARHLVLVAGFLGLLTACGGGGGGGAGPGPGGSASVCGGEITSTPKLCSLSVSPNPVHQTGSIRITLGISDLEGDVDVLCLGLAAAGGPAVVLCDAVVPAGTTINEVSTTEAISLVDGTTGEPLLLPGEYQIAVNVGDAAGHTSNAVSTVFSVVP